jgi:hypothetical protein
MRRFRLASLLLLPCLLCVSGCGEAVTFNNTIMELTADLEETSQKFEERVSRHEGKPGRLEEDHADAVKEAAAIVKRARAVRVPQLTGAKELHSAFLDYAQFEEDVVQREFRKVVSAATRGDGESIQNNLQRIEKIREKAHTKLRAVQKTFAEANNVPVME